jgi:hypothetical protein
MMRTKRHLSRSFVAVGLTAAAVVGLPSLAGAAAGPYPYPEKTVAPGEALTLSGTGCLIDGQPGYVAMAIADISPNPTAQVLPVIVSAEKSGAWEITNTIPSAIVGDLYVVAAACGNEEGKSVELAGATYVLHVNHATTPGTVPGGHVVPTPEAVEKAVGKVDTKKVAPKVKPKAVKAKPTFTG